MTKDCGKGTQKGITEIRLFFNDSWSLIICKLCSDNLFLLELFRTLKSQRVNEYKWGLYVMISAEIPMYFLSLILKCPTPSSTWTHRWKTKSNTFRELMLQPKSCTYFILVFKYCSYIASIKHIFSSSF